MKRTYPLCLWQLVLCCALALGATAASSTAQKGVFRVMTYNIHHGEGLDGKVDLERIAALIKQEGVDIVALQEVDKGTERTGRRDFPAELARLLGMSCIFSNNYDFQGGEYGNAVLTRFPVRHVTNTHFRMLGPGEPRGLLQVVLDVRGRELVFMDTHLDFRADDSELLANAAEVREILKQYAAKPVVLCGDFNDVPGSRTYDRFSEMLRDCWEAAGEGSGFTIPANKPAKRIDYIWASTDGAIEPLKLRVVLSDASDHLPVVGEFRLAEAHGTSKTLMRGSLEQAFTEPPAAARPWVYWYFMDGNLTQEGMTADLEAMKQAGIGGGIYLEVDIGIPRGPVGFMSPKWQELLAHSLQEAGRQGIEIALGTGPGWCGTGGPWLKPEQTMQHLVASETNVTGPLKFSAPLLRPQPRTPYFGEGTLTPELKKQWQEFYRDVAVLAFPTPDGRRRLADVDEKALYFREPYSSKPGVKPFLPAPAEFPVLPKSECIALTGIRELTDKMSADGRLGWNVPPGRWTIMRLGRTLTGQTTRPAPLPGLGFETDKFDRAALDAHYAAFIQKLLSQAGPRTNGHGGLTMLHFDSWEMGSQNWSPAFRAELKKRRGYDALKYLPAFSGRIVGSPEVSERFLWDVRQTAQELVVENHVGYLKELAHKSGLGLSVEPYDLNPCADLTLGRVADVPQCEFWYLGFNTFYSVIEAASIAHTCGRSVVAAEAFTSDAGEDWKADPAALKPLGDWAFCAGVNRLIFHRFQAQPWNDRRPGMTMGPYGVHWDRTQTWWDMAGPYHQYLARCQALLQRGVTVADVCFLAAEGAPHVFRPPTSAAPGAPPEHSGYNFDGCAPETVLEGGSVKDGELVFQGGTHYRVLVLPERQTMTPKLLRKIKALVRDGATVFGPPPIKSPSLEQFPRCDVQVKQLARETWGEFEGKSALNHPLGKGRVLWRKTQVQPGEQYGDYSAVLEVLSRMNAPPDFEAPPSIRFIHRRDGEAEIYFVANREQKAVETDCVFRVSGKQPELFDPTTGSMRPLAQFSRRSGRTVVPLRFEPAQSFFVVFRAPAEPVKPAAPNFPAASPVLTLDGSWDVSFDPKWGGPEQVLFTTLDDWSTRIEPGIKYYSGTAVYRKTIQVSDATLMPGTRYSLDLGQVKNLARVRLNGRDLGVVWCAPWRVDATGILQRGTNQLEIQVANLWPNRLIGDQSLPPEKRFTWTTLNPYKKDSPLLPSGLLGPVRILSESGSR